MLDSVWLHHLSFVLGAPCCLIPILSACCMWVMSFFMIVNFVRCCSHCQRPSSKTMERSGHHALYLHAGTKYIYIYIYVCVFSTIYFASAVCAALGWPLFERAFFDPPIKSAWRPPRLLSTLRTSMHTYLLRMYKGYLCTSNVSCTEGTFVQVSDVIHTCSRV